MIRLSSAQGPSEGFNQSIGYGCGFLKDLKGLLEPLPTVTLTWLLARSFHFAGCWQETSVAHYMGPSTSLPQCPHDVTDGFSQSQP